MKIRKGFVSNSSSSSFIVDGNKYTCVDIALQMLETLNLQDDYTGYDISKQNLLKLEDKNVSIFMPCCDDIHIVKKDNMIYIDASYHYDWDLDFIKQNGEGEYSDILYDAENYYFPRYDNKYLGKLADDDDERRYPGKWIYNCDACYCRLLETTKGIIFCPNCLTDPYGKKISLFFREDKLERILKK